MSELPKSKLTPVSSVQIDEHVVGVGHAPLLIAEIGINHNGSIAQAKEMIRQAKTCGATVVKFQKRHLDELFTDHLLEHVSDYEQGFQYILPYLKQCEFSESQMQEIKEYCDALELTFLCTPFDVTSAQFLRQLNLAAYKVSSADLTNMPLIEELASYGKPLLISTGMSIESEIEYTVDFLKSAGSEFILLHCVSSYPVDPQNANLERLKHLSSSYKVPVGYSGHDLGTSLSLVAISLGACVIEKHFTLDRTQPGPDHKVSLLPEELRRLAAQLRQNKTNGVSLAVMTNKRKETILQGELLNKQIFRKSIVVSKSLKMGEIFTEEHLTLRSPGGGFTGQEFDKVLGKSAVRDFTAGEVLSPENISYSPLTTSTITAKSKDDSWGRWGYVARYHDFHVSLQDAPTVLEFHLTYNDTKLEIPKTTFEKYREQLRDITLRVHCCEYLENQLFDLCSTSTSTRNESQKVFQRVLDITDQLREYFADEQPAIVFNCGAMTLQYETRSKNINEEVFFDSINSLSTHGALLLAQNMPPYPWYYGGQWKGHYFLDPQELLRFCQRTGHAICLDLSHASMAARYLDISLTDYIATIKDHVRHIHVSDACSMEGEGAQVGCGDITIQNARILDCESVCPAGTIHTPRRSYKGR